MIRLLNFACVAVMGFSVLVLYHVSEKTRVAHMELLQVNNQIRAEKTHLSVLETEWQDVASPEHIQQLAQARLNMTDTASVQMSSFDQLPRREDAPLNNSPVHAASAQVPASSDSGM